EKKAHRNSDRRCAPASGAKSNRLAPSLGTGRTPRQRRAFPRSVARVAASAAKSKCAFESDEPARRLLQRTGDARPGDETTGRGIERDSVDGRNKERDRLQSRPRLRADERAGE